MVVVMLANQPRDRALRQDRELGLERALRQYYSVVDLGARRRRAEHEAATRAAWGNLRRQRPLEIATDNAPFERGHPRAQLGALRRTQRDDAIEPPQCVNVAAGVDCETRQPLHLAAPRLMGRA